MHEAWTRFPSIEAARAEIGAAESDIRVARDAYLPHASFHAELNRATRNNVLGMMMPNQTITPINGFALSGESWQSAFGTSIGMFVRWEAYDFGARRAKIVAAEAKQAESSAKLELVRYELADRVADSYFVALAAARAEVAAEATVERWRTTQTAVNALVQAGLRPGADASRLRAELARAEADLILARQSNAHALAELGRYLANPTTAVVLEGGFAQQAVADRISEEAIGAHPLMQLRAAERLSLSAAVKATEKEWFPKLEVFSAANGRGSGARIDGSFRGGLEGLYPDIGNWAAGAGITINLFERKRSRSRSEVQSARVDAASARLSESELDLRTLTEQARIQLEAARGIAAKMPEALDATRELETQSQVRYRSGLGTITEIADAQRALRQAEVDDAVSRIQVWRAAFGVAAASGNLTTFLEQIP
ncbi:MAG: TolC family protein [Bryobacterales bacterium]|nr:TolC family protein [Bryobacterales bacterium]